MHPTIVRLSAQALLGRRRGIVLALIPVVFLVLTVVIRALTDAGSGSAIVGDVGYTLVLPLVALLAAAAVLGPEFDDGSIVYLLAKPVDRHRIAVSKFAVAWTATMLLGALPLFLGALVLDAGEPVAALAWGVGGVVAGTTYTALFLALAALTRHAVVAGLLFVLLWEGLLGNLLVGIRWVSIGAWGREVAASVAPSLPDPDVGLAYPLVGTALLLLGALWFAGDRLRSFTLRGDE